MNTKATKTEGAVKAGDGDYCFKMDELTHLEAGTGYSTSHGGVVEGERMLVGYIHKPRGTGSRLHSHPNEQLNFVLKGTLEGEINGTEFSAPQGSLIYIPAEAPHWIMATQEEDVIFLALKDLSHGIVGLAIDGTMSGPKYDLGFEPKEA
ncbi:MAG: cupin domain-containing protein [Rhodospirillaceae bacterium]|jgi:quercetin dioxygenase-like cupin family protein|nr:cupin domain-containing protein [Rhodospirillaceae bacterium]MBT7268585.1 cupin domain-containing protein [Rhodospirillaceae bacterium]